MHELACTPGQTVGPFFHCALTGSLRRNGAAITGWGRCATDAVGHYSFTTLAPGAPAVGRAAFFAITVFARGLLNRLFTRAYMPHANLDVEPLLARLDAARRDTLICRGELGDSAGYRFDIHLQGEPETVFLAYCGGPG
jgi:protocatechuate 3,4-dioxygenase alpha subunit